MLSRRSILKVGSVAGGAMLIPVAEAAQAEQTRAAGASVAGGPFSVRMPLPPVLTPAASLFGTDIYQLDIKTAQTEIVPGVKTEVLTYGGSFVGPTIRVKRDQRAVVNFRNQALEASNVHLHGGHVPADSDGHPMEVIEPGDNRWYTYPNKQRASTLWYHDHSHHLEAEHVYRGLSGFYLIEEDSEKQLNLPSGAYDVPIMLRDVLLDESGQLVYDALNAQNRNTLVANGKAQPYFQVSARKYRFRILNAATHRIFQLSLGGATFWQIGTDGGLLPAPVAMTSLKVTPAERADIVVDFSAYPVGTQLFLTDAAGGQVIRFDVAWKTADPSRLPATLRALPALGVPTVYRDFKLAFDYTTFAFGINDRAYDDNRVDAQIKRGNTEIWKITNADVDYGGITHNFHMHLVQFRVLDRDGVAPTGGEAGLKDTVAIPPGSTVRLQVTFTDYIGRYVFHCHVLEHSSFGMMAQLEITP